MNKEIKDLIVSSSKEINYHIGRFVNVRDAIVSITLLGDKGIAPVTGVELFVMLNLDEFSAESISKFTIGTIPDFESYEENIILARDVTFKEFSIELLLADIEFYDNKS